MATSKTSLAEMATIDLSQYDPEQSRLMDERCIVVDENDNMIGALDKKTCTRSISVGFNPEITNI
jgi:isopentenyl-diphosphate delta-isomerase